MLHLLHRIHEIPGHFALLDAWVFARLSAAQRIAGVKGDLLEVGAFFGRSSVVIGALRQPGERFHVNDLFETPPPTEIGRRELAQSPATHPTRADFEHHYGRFHDDRPDIHQRPSAELRGVIPPSSVRFAHIDGSHTCEAVKSDIELARETLVDGGIVAFDDYSNIGHLGVAAALWPALERGDLIPFAATPDKLFATTSSAHVARYRAAIDELAVAERWERRISSAAVDADPILTVWPPAPRNDLAHRVLRKVSRVARARAPHLFRHGRSPRNPAIEDGEALPTS